MARTKQWGWVLGMAGALGVGFAAGSLQRDAHAQSIATSTIYVPAGGLVFRAADGTPLARLSRGPHGGSFVLYDDRGEEGAARQAEPTREPYVIDEGDPFKRADVPGQGF